MARSHAARQDQRPASDGGRRREAPRLAGRCTPLNWVARASFVTGIVGFCAALPLLSGTAEAMPRSQPPAQPLALSVISVSPAYAQQGQTITITGQIRNLASTASTGLSVRLMSSNAPLRTRSDLESFANGSSVLSLPPANVHPVLIQNLSSGKSWRFTIRVPVARLGLSCFGVYPLVVQATDSAFNTASDPVPLPYWPPKATSCATQRRPQPFPISWVWPLIDTPHQNVCAGLTDNSLAARIARGGRLSDLLAVGARYGSRAGLTWAVDPSLLEALRAMTRPYQVGAAGCRHGAGQPADPDASRWLASLRKATTGQPLFLTPYADVDVAALIRQRNRADIHNAFMAADQVGQQILGRNLVPATVPAGPRQFSAIAWPASGTASPSVLSILATQNIDTIVLSTPAVSPLSYTPGAVSNRPTGIGRPLRALLADHTITALLGGRIATSTKPADIFHVSQLYVAETAMIASEAPSIRRPIMIAPPRRWDPSRQLATNLLADTTSAPWLQPSTVGQMVSLPAKQAGTQGPQNPSPAELPASLIRGISKLDHRIQLLQSIRTRPDPGLNRAVYAIESSAWRGKGVARARALLEQASDYVYRQLHGVTIQSGGGRHRAYQVTLGGKTGSVPLAIHSDLRYAVTVALRVVAKHAAVKGVPRTITVPPLGYSRAVKLNVHVKGAQGRIRLTLVVPAHKPLADHPLPAFPLVIVAHPTDFGTVVLVLFAAALALFVILSAARAIKNGRPEPPEESNDIEGGTQPPAPDEQARSMPTHEEPASPRSAPASGATVMDDDVRGLSFAERPRASGQDRVVRRPSPSGWVTPPDLPAEGVEGDRIGAEGFPNADNRPEYADSVGSDRSELTSAGPSVADQEPRQATEERR